MANPKKNLAKGVPKFSRSFRNKFIKDHGFTTRTVRVIEQVYCYIYYI